MQTLPIFVARWHGGMAKNGGIKALRTAVGDVNRDCRAGLKWFHVSMKDGKPHAQRIHSNAVGFPDYPEKDADAEAILRELNLA